MKFIVKTDIYRRLDTYLHHQGLSQKLIKDTKNHGDILVNGIHQNVDYKVEYDDLIEVIFPKEESRVVPIEMELKIIYEDEYLMILDKPQGIAMIPNKLYYTNSIANGIMYYYKQNHIESSIHIVNRLDKNTSGYFMVAKSRYIHDIFSRDIKSIKRIYHAYVQGHINDYGTIDLPIAHSAYHPVKRTISTQGVKAITHYHKIKDYQDYSLVECELETGRTHQIRVHMQALHHPLLGDDLYNENDHHDYYLRSVSISFIHPITKEKMYFQDKSLK